MPLLKTILFNNLDTVFMHNMLDLLFSDVNQPFARWDTDRVALWLHVLGLSMYIGNCRRWVKNGEQLLKASNRDLEKVGGRTRKDEGKYDLLTDGCLNS